jgi:predicted nucleic acid-binding protein
VLENVKKIDIYFQLNLITADQDDNKFVDCAFAGNVHFLVTNDKHYNILKSVTFPLINVITLDEFKKLIAV